MKYFVIATHWDDKRKAPVKYIAGEFDRYMNAVLFRDAYNSYYLSLIHISEPTRLGI